MAEKQMSATLKKFDNYLCVLGGEKFRLEGQWF